MKLYAVRHTKVVVNGEYFCYGFTDVNVTESFYNEAENTKNSLKTVTPDMVFTSPLSRAVKLATYCGYATATSDRRLMEMNFGDWEMKQWENIMKSEQNSSFLKEYINKRVPNGESLNDQLLRVKEFVEEQKNKGLKTVLIFCHGGVINCLKTLTGRYNLENAFETLPDFGSVTEFEF